MNNKQRVEAFKAFKEANEDAKKEVQKIVDEAFEIASNLYKKEKGEAKINVVDALNLDFYYEPIICAKYCISNISFYIGDMEENGTEEEFAFVFQRLNDLMETAKSNFEKVKHLVSKYD